MLTQALREIKVLCEPANTPDSIDVDVTDMDAGHSLHVSDLKVGAGIEINDNPEAVVATIVSVKEADQEAQTEAGAEPAAAGDAPAETEGGE